MIDVVFLLIIFLMVGTKFTEEDRKIDVQVPAVGQAAAELTAAQKRIISVLRDGSVILDEQPLSVTQLTTELRAARQISPRLRVTIRGDAQGAFQHVATVMCACRSAGVRDMSISVKVARR